MESLGHYLKVQRRLRDVSLEDVGRSSKVSPNWLVLLEEDAFDKLPGDIFTKGYLRLYAEAVGLDPDDVVLRYEVQCRTAEVSELHRIPFWRRRDAWQIAGLILGVLALCYWVASRFVFVPQLIRHL